MSRLWLMNVPPEATDDEIRQLAKKNAPQLDCVMLQREPGDGTRPAAIPGILRWRTQLNQDPRAEARRPLFERTQTGCTTII